jgi:hypothetical protein
MRRLAVLLIPAILVSACGAEEAGPGPGGRKLDVSVASYDLAAGDPDRLLLGLGTGANLYVSGGTVEVELFYLGEEEASGEPEPVGRLTASFLPLPGSPDPGTDHPLAEPASDARGVYVAEDVTFDRAGFYGAGVTADLGGGDVRRGEGVFQVLEEHQYPAPGDRAIPTENLTIDSEAPPEAIDSRAQTSGDIADPELHATTIADALRRGRPVLAVFATPVYCVSKFCGPVTDMVQELAAEYGDAAEFIHVEIWRDFEDMVVNEGAAEWLLQDGSLQEPWVYLIGGNGRILARWGNVATRQEIEPWLERL